MILDSGDEKHSSRPKRNIKKPPTQDGTEKKNEEWEDQLHADQIKYQPQHEPGAPENFVANAVRLNYFNEVLALKFGKYGQLNSTRPNSNYNLYFPLFSQLRISQLNSLELLLFKILKIQNLRLFYRFQVLPVTFH